MKDGGAAKQYAQHKFEVEKWINELNGVLSDEWIANLKSLALKHPEMFKSEADVFRVIKEIKDNPTHFFKNNIDKNALMVKHLDDKKVGEIGVRKSDGQIVHVTKNNKDKRIKELERRQDKLLGNTELEKATGRRASTDTPVESRTMATANKAGSVANVKRQTVGTSTLPTPLSAADKNALKQDANSAGEAYSSATERIIPQNSAKDEETIKTYVNPHVGIGLAGGTLNAKDENGNFDAEKFAKGFIYGLFGSKVTAEQGSKLDQAEAKQEVVKGEAKNQQFNNTNVDYTSAVKNIVERKELALRLDPKADILSVVKDFSKPIKTPIFTSKISVDKILNHLADKIDGDRRLEYINLVKPTLEKPLFITQESINGAQRFRFFKTFIDEKDKVVKFLNVVEDKNGELIEITATPIKNTDLKNLLKGKVIWGGDTLSDLSTPQTAKQGSEADKAIISQNSAKEARYRKTKFSEARIEDNGGVGGWEYKRTPVGYDKNYKADFLITKADIAKIRGGKIDEQGSKIEQAGAK